jgi:putative transposase
MDGKGRWMDNRFIERLWRSVKYESIYLWGPADARAANQSLRKWFDEYNTWRPHQALHYATPREWNRTPENYGARAAAWT